MPKLLLVRHGQSTFNNESKFCGWIDADLTDKGIEQAINISELIKSSDLVKDTEFHALFTSKLKRAVKTSNRILDSLNRNDMNVVKSWRLNERHYGALQNMKKNDILNEFGKEKFMYWRRNYHGCPPESNATLDSYQDTLRIAKFDEELSSDPNLVPKSESLEMVIKRLVPFYEHEISENLKQGKNILCVTHGSVVRALLKVLYELSEEDVEHLNIPNGMPILIDFDISTLKPIGKTWTYLEPEKAKIEAELVKNDGFDKK